ncbi:MAG TPA: hypothetical protein VJH65_03175 [Candidatus Nanoarchaeia archaeon]|nr:hypothetical protein [Candidatus Nanoarchaeia archaeon]
MITTNKKAAMELTMGTMVTIVLVVAALILGLVLVQKIFTGATESVDIINTKVQSEINNLFADESSTVIVKLGADNRAKIRVGTDYFGIGIGAITYDGGQSSRERLQYKLKLDEEARTSCVRTLGKEATENLLNQNVDTWISFDAFDGSNSYAVIAFTIPKATPTCTQKIYVDVKDTQQTGVDVMAGTAFTIELLKRFI